MLDVIAALRQSGETLPIAFIRYNPHAFNINHALANLDVETVRDLRLIELIQTWEPCADFEIQYMYYDTYEVQGHLRCEVWDHKDYEISIEQCCRRPIIA